MTRAYSDAKAAYDKALANLLQASAGTCDEQDAHELLELARVLLHRQIDDQVDDEARRWPSPRRVIARARRYAELPIPRQHHHEVEGR